MLAVLINMYNYCQVDEYYFSESTNEIRKQQGFLLNYYTLLFEIKVRKRINCRGHAIDHPRRRGYAVDQPLIDLYEERV